MNLLIVILALLLGDEEVAARLRRAGLVLLGVKANLCHL